MSKFMVVSHTAKLVELTYGTAHVQVYNPCDFLVCVVQDPSQNSRDTCKWVNCPWKISIHESQSCMGVFTCLIMRSINRD